MNLKLTIGSIAILLLCPLVSVAQQDIVLPQTGAVKLLGTVTFEEVDKSFQPNIYAIKEAPKPATDFGNRKALVNARRLEKQPVNNTGFPKKAGSAINPDVNFVTLGSATNGTPNDNDVAVSDSGLIVSVLNSNMRVTNQSGAILKNFTLRLLANIPIAQSSAFDPRVVYDPDADRFIVMFLNGRDETSNSYICFSKTNDPTKDWYAYKLPGSNVFGNDSTWTDYPIISITKEDLFITLNIVKNNTDWRVGFVESMIWQVNKKSGFDGDTALKYNKWHNVKFNNRPVRSICPAQEGYRPGGPNAYFLSVRPTDLQNDSIFLTEVTNSLNSGTATLTTKLVKASRNYGFPPNAPQQGNTKWLSTNDGRVLTAMVHNGMLQFAGNCVDTNFYTAGVFHGRMKVTDNTATLNIISSDTADYAYPDIAYAGNGQSWDNSAMLTFSRVSQTVGAGTAAMYINRNFGYSDIKIIQNGTGVINVLADTLQRWGDYTGIQRKYNETRTFWLSGSLAQAPGHGTVIAKISNPDPMLSIPTVQHEELKTLVYPNPTADMFSIEFEMEKGDKLSFNLYDINGRLVSNLLDTKVKAGTNIFSFSTMPLATGTYFLRIEQGPQILRNEKIVVSR